MNNNDIPVWEKYTLTIEEASQYFRIGENKLRRLAQLALALRHQDGGQAHGKTAAP